MTDDWLSNLLTDRCWVRLNDCRLRRGDGSGKQRGHGASSSRVQSAPCLFAPTKFAMEQIVTFDFRKYISTFLRFRETYYFHLELNLISPIQYLCMCRDMKVGLWCIHQNWTWTAAACPLPSQLFQNTFSRLCVPVGLGSMKSSGAHAVFSLHLPRDDAPPHRGDDAPPPRDAVPHPPRRRDAGRSDTEDAGRVGTQSLLQTGEDARQVSSSSEDPVWSSAVRGTGFPCHLGCLTEMEERDRTRGCECKRKDPVSVFTLLSYLLNKAKHAYC